MKAFGIGAIALLLLAGCATQPKSTPLAWNAERIGRAPQAAVRLQGPQGQTVATVSTDRIRKILDAARRVEKAAGITAQVVIVDGEQPNAFANRGRDGVNRIGFTLGMLDLLQSDYDAFAAIIGHELAHLVLDHGAIRREREETRSAASEVLGIALAIVGVPLGATVADLATTTVSRTFSRDEERDADKHGIDYATQAGFDPNGALRAWEKMAQRPSGSLLPFLSTHPAPQERIETIRQVALAAEGSRRPQLPSEPARATPEQSGSNVYAGLVTCELPGSQ